MHVHFSDWVKPLLVKFQLQKIYYILLHCIKINTETILFFSILLLVMVLSLSTIILAHQLGWVYMLLRTLLIKDWELGVR